MSWQMLLSYWRGKHVGNTPPARADLDPMAEVTALVPNLFLVDVAANTFRFRLIGSELMLRAGVDLTGLIVDPRTVRARGVDIWMGFLRRAARDCTPVLCAYTPVGHASVRAMGLLVPLVNDGVVDMLLGGLFFDATSLSAELPPLLSWELIELAIPGDLTDEPMPIRSRAVKRDTPGR